MSKIRKDGRYDERFKGGREENRRIPSIKEILLYLAIFGGFYFLMWLGYTALGGR